MPECFIVTKCTINILLYIIIILCIIIKTLFCEECQSYSLLTDRLDLFFGHIFKLFHCLGNTTALVNTPEEQDDWHCVYLCTLSSGLQSPLLCLQQKKKWSPAPGFAIKYPGFESRLYNVITMRHCMVESRHHVGSFLCSAILNPHNSLDLFNFQMNKWTHGGEGLWLVCFLNICMHWKQNSQPGKPRLTC